MLHPSQGLQDDGSGVGQAVLAGCRSSPSRTCPDRHRLGAVRRTHRIETSRDLPGSADSDPDAPELAVVSLVCLVAAQGCPCKVPCAVRLAGIGTRQYLLLNTNFVLAFRHLQAPGFALNLCRLVAQNCWRHKSHPRARSASGAVLDCDLRPGHAQAFRPLRVERILHVYRKSHCANRAGACDPCLVSWNFSTRSAISVAT